MLVQTFQSNSKIRTFTSRVNFLENNKIITACGIKKLSTRVTMNEVSTNNGLNSHKS